MRIHPQSALGLPCFRFQPLQLSVLWRILPVPPRKACLHNLSIQVSPIRQYHISHCSPVAVLIFHFDFDPFPEYQCGDKLFGSVSNGLPFLRRINSLEPDLLSHLSCSTVIVSPSEIPTTRPEKSSECMLGHSNKRVKAPCIGPKRKSTLRKSTRHLRICSRSFTGEE